MGIGSSYHFLKWIESANLAGLPREELMRRAYEAGFEKGWSESNDGDMEEQEEEKDL